MNSHSTLLKLIYKSNGQTDRRSKALIYDVSLRPYREQIWVVILSYCVQQIFISETAYIHSILQSVHFMVSLSCAGVSE